MEILTVCALCLLSTGFQNGLSAYIFPAAQFSLQLTLAEIGFLNVSFLIGATCSAFLWGIIADLNGRKKVLTYTLFINFCITLLLAFMNSFYGFAICRLLNGFLIGAPGTVTFTYLAEFHSPKLRMKIVCYSGIFFTLSWLILPILAYLILPLSINISITSTFQFTSWRLLLIVISIPEIITSVWLMKLPESPKFLDCKGNYQKAQRILRNIYTINTGRQSEDYPVKSLKRKVLFHDTIAKNSVNGERKIARIVQDVCNQMKLLFQAPFLGLTTLISFITFSNMFSYFGLSLWIPDIFTRFEEYHRQYPNRTLTFKILNTFETHHTTTPQKYTPEFDFAIFKYTSIIGICSIIGSVLSGWVSGKVSIKLTPSLTMLLAGLSSAFIYFVQSINQFFILATIFQSAMTTANMVIGSITVELYPTNVSAMAFCTAMCIGRIGAIISNLIFGIFMNKQCEIPILLVCIFSIIGGILSLCIPSKSIYCNANRSCNNKE